MEEQILNLLYELNEEQVRHIVKDLKEMKHQQDEAILKFSGNQML